MELLRFENHVKMPWKNGLGESLQISIEPKAALLTDFHFRLSSALVQKNNDFSVFKGKRRLLCAIEGTMRLHFEDAQPQVLNTFDVTEFSGDQKIRCEIFDNEVIDLGLIFEPTLFTATMTIENASLQTFRFQTGVHFLVNITKHKLRIDDSTLSYLDVLKIENPTSLRVHAKSSEQKIAIVSIKNNENATLPKQRRK